MSSSDIAILLTTFNGERYLAEQIESLIAQRDVGIKIYVFDDGSTDNTISILESYKHRVDMSVHVNTHNSGGTGINILKNLRDFGFRMMQECTHIALCDQDDVWLPDKLIRAVRCLEQNCAGLYCSNLEMWQAEAGTIGMIRKDYPMKRFDYLFEGGSAGCTYVLERSYAAYVIGKLQDYPLQLRKRVSHDWLIYFLARTGGWGITLDKQSRILYRIHEASQYGGLNTSSLSAIKKRISMIRDGFYQQQIHNYLPYIERGTPEYMIYDYYLRSRLTRAYVLARFNTQLMRSNKKFLVFALLSMLFVRPCRIDDMPLGW